MTSSLDLSSVSRRTVIGGLAATVSLGALSTRTKAAAPLDIVASTGMIADAVRMVGGAHVSVHGLMGAGVDPHAYRQTRSDIVAMTRADGVLWHGLYLEAQMEEFLLDLGARQPVVAVAEALPRDLLLAHEDYEGRFDPHVWMDPTLWALVVEEVRRTLTELAPDAGEVFAANAASYTEELAALDAYTRESLAQLSPEQRVLVTAHDAFGYFGKAHDFEVVGIQGISTESEAGLSRITEMVEMLVSRDLRAVFVETSVSDRNMRALVEGAAARGHEVRIGGSLFSDAMGPEGTYEGTYLGMMDHNVTTIARALGADVPEGGRLGKLTVTS